MRDLVVLIFLLFFLTLAFSNVFAAYLLWGWFSLIGLNGYLYGPMAAIPYVLVFAVISLLLIFVRKNQGTIKFKPNRTSVIFILLLAHGYLCAVFAYPGLVSNWELYSNMVKILLFCLLMPMLVTNRFRIHAVVLMMALGLGFHGLLDGLKFIATSGRHIALGVGKFGDNNHFAVLMVMALPVFIYLYQYSDRRLVRLGFLSVLILTCFSVMATNSRGGFLSIMVLALMVVMWSRRKLIGISTIVIISLLMLNLASDSWSTRMNTIQVADQDNSFMGRVTSWKRASAIALENPLLGGGFHAGAAPVIFDKFRYKEGLLGFVDTPDITHAAATHSIYFEVLGDLGFPGLFLFLACLANALVIRFEIMKILTQNGPELAWARDLANLMAASLVVYMVGGAALSIAYQDLPYIFMMLMQVLKTHVQTQVSISVGEHDRQSEKIIFRFGRKSLEPKSVSP